MKSFKLILISLFFCSANVFAQQEEKEIYTDKLNDFVITFPDQWDLEQGQDGEITLYPPFPKEIIVDNYSDEDIESDLDEEAEHVFEEKIQFTPSRWDEGDLEEFVEKNFLSADLTEYFDGFSIIKEGKEKINGNDAIWFIANFNVGQEEATSFFYFIKMFNRVISITTFCMTEDFELKYKIKYLEIIRSTKSYLDSKGKNRR
ncbi:MAG: hypothetical protein PHN41_03495 [Bacteroidales bacterium]|jgi:hypothetical protein|nr:hypothetical protein [Bacteroidales bacterium]MDD4703691.1 hypothetical protein [Bacteroidales bacterium]